MASPVSHKFSYFPGEDGGAFLRLTGAFTLGGNYFKERYGSDDEKSYFTKGFEVSLGVPIRLQGGTSHFMPTLMVRRIWSTLNTEVLNNNAEITNEILYANHTALEILPWAFGGPIALTSEGDVWLAFLNGIGIYFFDENSDINLDLGALNLALITRLELSFPLGQPHLNLLLGARFAAIQFAIERYSFDVGHRLDISGYVGLGGYTPDFNTWGKKATARTGDEEESTPPVRKDDPQVVDPKPVPTPAIDPEVQAIIDDIGPWDPENLTTVVKTSFQSRFNFYVKGKSSQKYKVSASIGTDGRTFYEIDIVDRDTERWQAINLSDSKYKPLSDFLAKEYTISRFDGIFSEWYGLCQKSLGGNAEENFELSYEEKRGRVIKVYKTFSRGSSTLQKISYELQGSSLVELQCSRFSGGSLIIDAKPGSPLHTQYIKPFEDELRPYLEQEQARQAAQATPEPEPTPEEPTPPVRKDEPQVVDPKPVPEPAPSAVTPPRITSQEVISQTFDDRNIMSGTVEVTLSSPPEGGLRVIGQDGKEKPDKDIEL